MKDVEKRQARIEEHLIYILVVHTVLSFLPESSSWRSVMFPYQGNIPGTVLHTITIIRDGTNRNLNQTARP